MDPVGHQGLAVLTRWAFCSGTHGSTRYRPRPTSFPQAARAGRRGWAARWGTASATERAPRRSDGAPHVPAPAWGAGVGAANRCLPQRLGDERRSGAPIC